jgi:hypothetical protein
LKQQESIHQADQDEPLGYRDTAFQPFRAASDVDDEHLLAKLSRHLSQLANSTIGMAASNREQPSSLAVCMDIGSSQQSTRNGKAEGADDVVMVSSDEEENVFGGGAPNGI